MWLSSSACVTKKKIAARYKLSINSRRIVVFFTTNWAFKYRLFLGLAKLEIWLHKFAVALAQVS